VLKLVLHHDIVLALSHFLSVWELIAYPHLRVLSVRFKAAFQRAAETWRVSLPVFLHRQL
jgi:hypothetical protein